MARPASANPGLFTVSPHLNQLSPLINTLMSADYHHNSAAYHPLQLLVIITKHYSSHYKAYDLINALRALLLLLS